MLPALGVQGAVLLVVAVGAPFWVRLPLGLVWAFAVPALALVGLLRLEDRSAEISLSVALSTALGVIAAQLLVWVGLYSLVATAGLLAATSAAGLLLQLRLRPGPGPPVEPRAGAAGGR